MKEIKAIIKPSKLEDVKEALNGIGVNAMTVCEGKGFGRQRGHSEVFRGAEYRVDFVPKIQIDVVVEDEISKKVFEIIKNNAKTGKIGDGQIFIRPLEEAIRIRTGETGLEAI